MGHELKALAVSSQIKLSLIIKVAPAKCQIAIDLSLNIPVISETKSLPQTIFRVHLSMDLQTMGLVFTL